MPYRDPIGIREQSFVRDSKSAPIRIPLPIRPGPIDLHHHPEFHLQRLSSSITILVLVLPLAMSTYDFIIVGGGTAGCLLASRLSTSLPTKEILLIEAGKSHTSYPHITIPGHYLQFLTRKDMSFSVVSIPQKHLDNRRITIPRAKVVGGGSCANFMTWARGPSCDWDEWALRTGDESYAWENVLPILKSVRSLGKQLT
jgi:hypothetical protein